jgi:hypothetical protein
MVGPRLGNLGCGFLKPEPDGNSESNECLVPGSKRELVWEAGPLITEGPLKDQVHEQVSEEAPKSGLGRVLGVQVRD